MKRIATPSLGGRRVYARPGTSDEQVWADTYTGLYHVPPSSMPTPRRVLDLGANIGLVSAHYQELWPDADIVAVEMDKENAALIEKNAPRARVRVEAVSYVSGQAFYRVDCREDAYAVHTRAGDEPPGRVAPARTLRQIILRSFGGASVGGVNMVDFVKMDVEGMEWKILAEPDWAPLVRYLLVELHGDDPSDRLVRRAVAATGDAGFDARRYRPHPQAIFAWRR